MARSQAERDKWNAKYRDVRWQEKRLLILSRDGFTCRSCHASKEGIEDDDEPFMLHVHHLWYEGDNPWEAPSEALITLCEDCHEYESEQGVAERRLFIRLFQSHGWLSTDFNHILSGMYGNPPLHHVAEVEACMWAAAYEYPGIRMR